MENSPLNKAHQQQRKAEALLKNKKFDECIDCHKLAVEFLTEASTLTQNPRALESLQLQKDYNKKQIDVVRMKKNQHQIDQQRKNIQNEQKGSLSSSEGQYGDSLEAAIYRTIEIHDSLIDYLGKRGNSGGSDNESLRSYSTSDTDEKVEQRNVTPIVGNKHPKDDAQIIEELKVLSGQLRDSVQCLLYQLDDRNKEIERLKATIDALQTDKNKEKINASLRVVTDSSGGTSPYVFSPCSELSPDILNDSRTLPPLEMPNLDYLQNIRRSGNSNNNNGN